ncbi:MAG: amidohydrolase [Sulfuritalea sp.]|nr:amidohydrolase [Sulfuritalea sp.]
MPELYFVDAHSQLPGGLDPGEIIPLMNQAGVWRTILSARNDRDPEDVEKFTAEHPDRITAAVRSKGRSFIKNSPEFKSLVSRQMSQPVYKAMAEVLLFHAQKGKKAPRIEVGIDSPQVRQLLDITIAKKWPFIAHYEFKAAGSDTSRFMKEFEATLRAHPTHPFVLIHMGQLDAAEARRLIAAHGNVNFLMSHSNPVTRAENPGQPWANLFAGDQLSREWLEVILANPERFMLAFDNVWPEHWGRLYLDQAELWRKSLSSLPPAVAHAIAHGNAERLWGLAPR